MFSMSLIALGAIAAGAFLFVLVMLAIMFRVVVPTNMVHIVQRNKKTLTYGTLAPSEMGPEGSTLAPAGNVYYRWPSWVPRFGITRIVLPLSVFDIDLNAYSGYDLNRVPFLVDVMAFFRIENPAVAAERISSFDELQEQLQGILQGAIRSVLAASPIDNILAGRSEFGEKFTAEVDSQLKQWGVHTVKNIELMDLRDSEGSKVIANIMEKQKSYIEAESRIAVAENMKNAQNAETDAKRDVDLQKQEAIQSVGIRTAEQEMKVGIQIEQSKQSVADQRKITAEKDMQVKQVNDTRAAEIARTVAVTEADQKAQEMAKIAEGELKQANFQADAVRVKANADAEAARVKGVGEADAIRAKGEATGIAEQAMQMAPVNAQIALAKEIGENDGYQTYLIRVEGIKAQRDVGVEQAKAIAVAEIKVIANSGSVSGGVTGLMDMFTPQGGTQLGAMIEAFKQTPAGAEVVEAVTEKISGKGKNKAA